MKHIFCITLSLLLVLVSYGQSQIGPTILGEGPQDDLGVSADISFSGARIILGAPRNDGNGANSGHARVFEFDGSVWQLVGRDIEGDAAGDKLGRAVAFADLDSNLIALGAPHSDLGGQDAGSVKVFRYNGTDWIQQGQTLTGIGAGDAFGTAVSLSADGRYLVVGAPGNDAGGNDAGQVQIFRFDGLNWVAVGLGINGKAADQFTGVSVDISHSGNQVAIGAPGMRSSSSSSNGDARVYTWTGMQWLQQGGDLSGDFPGEQNGWSVSLSADGQTVAVGVPFAGLPFFAPYSGRVKVYQWNGLIWNQLGNTLNGPQGNSQFGRSVSLSDDGDNLVVGRDGLNPGGSFYELAENTSLWQQVGNFVTGINGEGLGTSSALSGDGSTYVLGAPANNCGNPNYVQVYLPGQSLPVVLYNLAAKVEDKNVILSWQTLQEWDHDHFEIEEQYPQGNWQKLGEIPGMGYSDQLQHYQFRQEAPLPGQHSYRLAMVDFDGAKTYSNPVNLRIDPSLHVSLSPNPATHSMHVRGFPHEHMLGSILDVRGLQVRRIDQTSGLLDLSGLPAGIYQLNLHFYGKRWQSRFVKQ